MIVTMITMNQGEIWGLGSE